MFNRVNKRILFSFMIFAVMLVPLALQAGKGKGKRKRSKRSTVNPGIGFVLPKHPNIGGLLPTVIRYGTKFSPLAGVMAYDVKDGYIDDITVSGQVNTDKPGTYVLTYSVTNSQGDTKTVKRKVTVLPQGTFAAVQAKGRRGPKDIITLDKSYQGRLADNLTFIEPVVYALKGTEYYFKLIERPWDASGYTTAAPAENEWASVKPVRFYRDLYLCMRPRIDRWLKITVKNGKETKSWVFGLKGDKGAKYHNPATGEDIWRLSREVDDPMTAKEQFRIYSQACSYWCILPFWLEKMMGCRAHVTTTGASVQMYNIGNDEEIHGFYTLFRAFLNGANRRSQSDANWKKIAAAYDPAFGMAMNASYRRSFQIPMAEMNGGDGNVFIKKFSEYYKHLRETFNPKRIIIGTSLRGQAKLYKDFYDVGSPYFKAEWHKGHFDSMYERFESEDKLLPCIISYPRINEVWRKSTAFTMLEVHRKIHRFAKIHNVEAAILDKIGNMGRFENGEWSTFSLPYYATWFCYDGYDYLNNGPFFADDWDGDGLSNVEERKHNTNPFHPDTDGDYMFDSLEVTYHLNPLDPKDALKDNDHDRMNNFNEIIAGSKTPGAGCGTPAHPALTLKTKSGKVLKVNPNNPEDASWDPDNDLLPAWFEVNAGLDPTNQTQLKNGSKFFIEQPDVNCAFAGMIANFAYHCNIDKSSSDVDGDGMDNLAELAVGRDPLKPNDSPDPRKASWAKLGADLFNRYFEPARYKKLFAGKRESKIFKLFAYSPTEHAVTAEVSIRSLNGAGAPDKAEPGSTESMMARMMFVLDGLHKHPELWSDQKKVITGVSSRIYLHSGKSRFRQDRGLYSIYIPIAVFKRPDYAEQIFAALKKLYDANTKLGSRMGGGAKGAMAYKLLETPEGIKVLFFDYLEKSATSAFRKARAAKKIDLGERFNYPLFKKEYTRLAENLNR